MASTAVTRRLGSPLLRSFIHSLSVLPPTVSPPVFSGASYLSSLPSFLSLPLPLSLGKFLVAGRDWAFAPPARARATTQTRKTRMIGPFVRSFPVKKGYQSGGEVGNEETRGGPCASFPRSGSRRICGSAPAVT